MPPASLSEQTIPTLSLNDFLHGDPVEQAQFVEQMGDALVDLGFFALVDHGVDPSLTQEAYECCRAFFALPTEVKMRYSDPALKGQRGYTCFGKEHAKDNPYPDLKEFWHIGREGSPYLGNLWPTEVPRFRSVFVELYRQLDVCGSYLLQACAMYLREPVNLLADMAMGGNSVLRVIHYPPIPLTAHPASIRAAAHEDINFITLLCEATAPGLELLQRDGTWLPIHTLPGQIIVDTGDMLQHLTNGLFRSTTHRVVNPDNDREQRFSMPFFIHPRPEVDLTPLPSCVAQTGGIPKYPPLTAGEFLEIRLKEIGLA
ncbi:MAG: 2-oxoglutarate and iron-dependent oxygenase domain-containing protein [Thermostichales cyanobacterium SZTDM-1c_bins_54]